VLWSWIKLVFSWWCGFRRMSLCCPGCRRLERQGGQWHYPHGSCVCKCLIYPTVNVCTFVIFVRLTHEGKILQFKHRKKYQPCLYLLHNSRFTLQNRRQKVFSRGLFVCAGGLDIIKLTKTPLKLFHVSIWGAWSFVWEGLSRPKPPRGDGTVTLSPTTAERLIFDNFTLSNK